MVRHSVFRWTVAVLALTWAGTAAADPIVAAAATAGGTTVSPLFATGDVEKDFNASSKSVTLVPGRSMNSVDQPQWMTDAGLINGYVMKDIRLSYDKASDTLAVGVNFWGKALDTDGSPYGQTNPKTIASGGSNPPIPNSDKSITVAFTPVDSKGVNEAPLVVAGIPAVKSSVTPTNPDGFTVAAFQNSAGGLARSYGPTMTSNVGSMGFQPSDLHPDFEFTVKNFSKIPGLNALTNGFYISAYAGTGSTIIIGKSEIFNTLVGAPLQQPQNIQNPPSVTPPTPPPITTPTVPEPTTILAWGLIAGGATWRVRRRARQPIRP